MNEILNSILLGIIQGMTEFLPVSSTGHLIIVNEFIGFTGEFAHMFDVVIHLGVTLSLVVFFWRRLFPFVAKASADNNRKIINLWIKTAVGVVPALVIGAAFGKYIQEYLFNPIVVSIALVAGGIVLIVLEKLKRRVTVDSIPDLSYKKALLIGVFQCLAMVPGTSRSAATIIGGMTLGCSRVAAAEFSFFLSIPTMMAASAYALIKFQKTLSIMELQILAIGFTVSFFAALSVITVFMKYISKNNFIPFGYYRILLGIIVFIYFYAL